MLAQSETIEPNLVSQLNLFQQITHALRWILRDAVYRCVLYKTIEPDLHSIPSLSPGIGCSDTTQGLAIQATASSAPFLPGRRHFLKRRARYHSRGSVKNLMQLNTQNRDGG
jgi:hypothetical protein